MIRGPLTVWYDKERHCFRMRDEAVARREAYGEEIQRASYVAPVQSGKY